MKKPLGRGAVGSGGGITEHLNAAPELPDAVALLGQRDGGRSLSIGRLVFVAKEVPAANVAVSLAIGAAPSIRLGFLAGGVTSALAGGLGHGC